MAMSIVEKSIRAKLRSGKEDAVSLFLRTHDYLSLKYAKQRTLQGSLETQLIQSYLQRIKNAILILQTNPNAIIADEFIEDFLSRCKKRGINILTLFNYYGLGKQKSGTKFETDLVNIFNACIPDENFDVRETVEQFGYKKGTSNLIFNSNELTGYYTKWLDALQTNVETKIPEWIYATYGTSQFGKSDLDLYRLGSIAGKIDVRIPQSKISINFTEAPEIDQFFSLINGKKLTVKNYFNINQVTLGNTNIFRIYMTLLPDLGITKAESLRMFYIRRYYASMQTQEESGITVMLHDYHIRFAYELMGIGLTYKGEKIGPADLLVINERNGQQIRVYNTYMILAEVLEKNQYSKARSIGFKT